MATITFESVYQFAKRLGVRVEREGRTYQVFKESDHGSVGEVNTLAELLPEVYDFAVGNAVFLDAAKPAKIVDYDLQTHDIRIAIEGREDFLVSPDRLHDKKTAEANFGVIALHTGDSLSVAHDLTRREAEDNIKFLQEESTIRGRLEYARLIQYLS